MTNLSNCCNVTSALRTLMTDQPTAESDKTRTPRPVVGQAGGMHTNPDPQT